MALISIPTEIMTAIASFPCKTQQLVSHSPAALPHPCAHARLSVGLDRACCPDCRAEFLPRTPEYRNAIAPPSGPKQFGSRVGGTREPKTDIPSHWVETYPTKKGLHHYYRYHWLDDPGDIRSGGRRHVTGGNIHSALALARKAEIESAIASGQTPRQILHLIKSWNQKK